MARPPKYQLNESYFNKIDSHEKAYILGFIVADGSISPRRGLNVTLQIKDSDVLNFIKKELQSTAPISVKSNPNGSQYSCLNINRKALWTSLSFLGVSSNKSGNNGIWIQVDDEFMPSYIRGFFDGDGSIWFKKSGYMAGFTGGFTFLTNLKSFLKGLDIECGSIRFRYGPENLNSCQLDISHWDNLKKLKDYIYSPGGFSLKRKFDKFNDAENHYNNWKKNRTDHNGQFEKIIEMYNNGLNQKEISDNLNVNYSTVRNCVAKARRSGLCENMGKSVYII